MLQVVSDDPEKWGDNKIVKQLTIAAPGRQEVARAGAAGGGPDALSRSLPSSRLRRTRRMDFELLVGIFPQVLLDGIILGFMYALIALGYTMVYGVLEFINFAHSEIFILGAFVGVEILLSLQERPGCWTAAVGPRAAPGAAVAGMVGQRPRSP